MTNKITTREASTVQETRVAEKFGGRRTSNSGAGHFDKLDVVIDSIKLGIECKTAVSPKDSFSIKKDWIDKNREEVREKRLDNGIIAFSYYFDDKSDYYVIGDKLMRYLIEKLKEDYKNSSII